MEVLFGSSFDATFDSIIRCGPGGGGGGDGGDFAEEDDTTDDRFTSSKPAKQKTQNKKITD